ncbi:DNA-directed RNA polymerase I subunit RPA34 isoform X1 [Poecilia latipinna]|uniref:RNA polymerase I subunit G n=1 Tax=Poecilia latipinna TaxID=48699 RepID=A0A3B3UZU5_9TELE|nr:PREDICTED: DNA-directed RNA polymerase I subunit RPA34 isoform X1 [Poecilia latipinna]
MPKDISSSSSEDETDNVAMETTERQKEPARKTARLECPEDFVSFCHVPCSSTLADNLRNNENELWLIKAPASFDPHCFSGVQVPLSGLQTLKVPVGPVQQSYSVLASSHPNDLHLLTSDSRTSDGFVFAPAFSGLLNICESYGDAGAERAPHVVPTALAPAIPSGLKQRFHPFGSKTPKLTYVAENEADGAAFGPSSTTLRPLVMKQFVEDGGRVGEDDEEEGRKRKKKKKKEKRIKSEEVEVLLQMKQEPSDENLDEVTAAGLPFGEEKTTKKKKKKKDREREEVEEGLEPGVNVKEESVSVKCEPLDVLYSDAAESSGKKKKKKKKSRTEEDVQS